MCKWLASVKIRIPKFVAFVGNDKAYNLNRDSGAQMLRAVSFIGVLLLSATARVAHADSALPLQSYDVGIAYNPVMQPSYLTASRADQGDMEIGSFLTRWEQIAKEARTSEPNWLKPIATSTARLGQEIRYDQFFEHQANGADLDVYDGAKGLSLIVAPESQVMLYLPAYEQRSNVKPASGWGDWPAFTFKERLVSADENHGNYAVSVQLGFQAPTGDVPFTNDSWLLTPTLAFGKGSGNFDIQSTIGVAAPLEHENVVGTSLASNVALQYHLATYFWPEVEINHTHWFDGARASKDQIFITPGILLGRFKLGGNINLIFGAGYQIAVTPVTTTPVVTPTYSSNWIITSRLTF